MAYPDKDGTGGIGGSGSKNESESSIDSHERAAESDLESDELFTDPGEEELYDPAYDHKEYEDELLDFSYEKDPDKPDIPEIGEKRNADGELIEGDPVIADEAVIKKSEDYNQTGIFNPDWNVKAENSDAQGFDTREEIKEGVLQPGTVIDRYGSSRGRMATSKGTEYEALSLPYAKETVEFHRYEVCAPIECRMGKVAPNFDQEGGGDQFVFSKSVTELIREGSLREVEVEYEK